MRRLASLPLTLLLALLLAAPGGYAQESGLLAWALTIGGDGETIPAAMTPASDGGAFIVGATSGREPALGEPYGGTDAFIARVDGQGGLLWARRFGGSGDDAFTHVLELPDGGCVAMGTSASADGDARAARGATDALAVMVDKDGALAWSKCLGGTDDDELLDMVLSEEGLLFVCGRTRSRNGDLGANMGGWDAWAALLELEDGKPLWVIRYGQEGDDQFARAYRDADGWLLLGELAEPVAGVPAEEPGYQFRPIVLKISDAQEELWQVTLGGVGVNRLHSLTEAGGGWLLTGETRSTSPLMPQARGGLDIWTLFLRPGGTMVWQRTFGGGRDERPFLLRAALAGGYALLGATSSGDGQVTGYHGGVDLWVLRLSATGALEWQQTIGGSGLSQPAGLLFTGDGGLLIAGTTASQDGDMTPHDFGQVGFLGKLASNGNLEWTRILDAGASCALLDMQASGGVGYLLGSLETEGGHAAWLARLAEEGFGEE